VRPQRQLISSKMASRHVPHGPLWQSSSQMCVPHLSSRPHCRVQMCSASNMSSTGLGAE